MVRDIRKNSKLFSVHNWVFVIVFSGLLAYFVVGSFSKSANLDRIKEVDKDFKASEYALAEVDCRKAIEEAEHPPLNLAPVTKRSLYERMAIILCFNDKLEEALPYFQKTLKEHLDHFQYRSKYVPSSDEQDTYNSYYESINISRIVFNYSRVLMHLHRNEDADEMFTNAWDRVLKFSHGDEQRMQNEKNAIDRLVNFYENDKSKTPKQDLQTALNQLESSTDRKLRIKEYMVWLRKTCLYDQKHLTYNDGVFDGIFDTTP